MQVFVLSGSRPRVRWRSALRGRDQWIAGTSRGHLVTSDMVVPVPHIMKENVVVVRSSPECVFLRFVEQVVDVPVRRMCAT